MIEKIEMLVAENADAFRTVLSSGAEKVGVCAAILFVMGFCLWNFWVILCPSDKTLTFKQEAQKYAMYVTSITGSYVLFLYFLYLIAVYTPVRYLIAYFALRSMYLL